MNKTLIVNKKTQTPVISFVGRSGCGKTTIMEKIIPELKQRGFKVGVIKHHAHNSFEIDNPGKDTWRHTRAGANTVAMISPKRTFLHQITEEELSLADIVDLMEDNDFIFTEGFSWENTMKIGVIRKAHSKEFKKPTHGIVAYITDVDIKTDLQIFAFEDINKITDFIEQINLIK